MKRSTLWTVLIYTVLLLALLTLLAACGGREATGGDAATQTIEPAKPQPGDTDTAALTQTVDVEAGRSEVEGRTASGADITAVSTDTATTTAATATTTAPPPTTTTR